MLKTEIKRGFNTYVNVRHKTELFSGNFFNSSRNISRILQLYSCPSFSKLTIYILKLDSLQNLGKKLYFAGAIVCLPQRSKNLTWKYYETGKIYCLP